MIGKKKKEGKHLTKPRGEIAENEERGEGKKGGFSHRWCVKK